MRNTRPRPPVSPVSFLIYWNPLLVGAESPALWWKPNWFFTFPVSAFTPLSIIILSDIFSPLSPPGTNCTAIYLQDAKKRRREKNDNRQEDFNNAVVALLSDSITTTDSLVFSSSNSFLVKKKILRKAEVMIYVYVFFFYLIFGWKRRWFLLCCCQVI